MSLEDLIQRIPVKRFLSHCADRMVDFILNTKETKINAEMLLKKAFLSGIKQLLSL